MSSTSKVVAELEKWIASQAKQNPKNKVSVIWTHFPTFLTHFYVEMPIPWINGIEEYLVDERSIQEEESIVNGMWASFILTYYFPREAIGSFAEYNVPGGRVDYALRTVRGKVPVAAKK